MICLSYLGWVNNLFVKSELKNFKGEVHIYIIYKNDTEDLFGQFLYLRIFTFIEILGSAYNFKITILCDSILSKIIMHKIQISLIVKQIIVFISSFNIFMFINQRISL